SRRPARPCRLALEVSRRMGAEHRLLRRAPAASGPASQGSSVHRHRFSHHSSGGSLERFTRTRLSQSDDSADPHPTSEGGRVAAARTPELRRAVRTWEPQPRSAALPLLTAPGFSSYRTRLLGRRRLPDYAL